MIKKTLMALALAGVAGFATAPDAVADGRMFGYNAEYYALHPRGLYEFSSTGEPTQIWYDDLAYPDGIDATHYQYAMTCGWVRDGKLCGFESCWPYMVTSSYYQYVEHDLEDGEIIDVYDVPMTETDWTKFFISATYCPLNDRIYGYGYNRNRSGYAFKTALASNPSDVTIIDGSLKTFGEIALGLTYDSENGRLVGYSTDGVIFSLDPNTGARTNLYRPNVPTNMTIDAINPLGYDASTGKYLLNFNGYSKSTGDYEGNLYEIDLNRQTMKLLTSYDDREYQFNLIVCDGGTLSVSKSAPAKVTDLKANFAEDAVEGSISFVLPTKTEGGDALSGTVNWVAYLDGVELKTGSNNAGETVTVPATVTKGFRTFRVVCSANGAEGLGALIMPMLGGEVPMAPKNIVMNRKTITWDAVTIGESGEEINKDDITYEVKIGTTSLGTTKDTKISVEDFFNAVKDKELTPYNALVYAKLKNNTSKAGESNIVVYGKPEELPYRVWPTQDQADISIAVDADKNNIGWEYYKTSTGEYVFSSGWGHGTDDWLFLPQVDTKGLESVSFNAIFQAADETLLGGSIEVYAGKEASVDAMKTVVIPEYTINVVGERELSGTVLLKGDLKDAEEVVFAIRALNPNDRCPINALLIDLDEGTASLNGPGAVTDVKVVENSEEMKLDVSFKLPTKTADGKDIPAGTDIKVVVRTTASASVTGKPGEEKSLSVYSTQGDNLIIITPFIGEVEGEPVSKVAFTGDDIPGLITNIRITFDETGRKMKAEWDAPTEGYYGGKLSDNRFSYEVYAYDSAEDGYVLATEVPIGLNFATLDYTGDGQSLINAAVKTINKAGACPELVPFTCIVGEPYKLPMIEDFEGDYLAYQPVAVYKTDAYEFATWTWARPATLGEKYADEKGYAYICQPTKGGVKSRIELPKFSTSDYRDVVLNFTMWNGKNASETTFKAVSFDSQPEMVNIETVKGGNEDAYKEISIKLPDSMFNNPWIALTLESDYPSGDDITIITTYKIGGLSSVGEFVTIYGSVTGGEESITVTGYEGSDIALYTIDGKLVKKVKATEDVFTFSAPKGMYVVKVEKQSSKVVVK